MYKVILFCLTVASLQAFAFPQIGDSAIYRAQSTADTGQTTTAFHTLEIIDYDLARRNYVIKQTIDAREGKSIRHYSRHENQIGSDAAFHEVIAKCELNGGVLEAVILQIGTFQTCRKSFRDQYGWNTTWMATVPFGFVKYEENRPRSRTVYEMEYYRQ